MKEVENKITAEDSKVTDALRSLPKVEAPMGFESGVRVRIAEGERAGRRPWFLRPAFGIPAAAAIAIGVFIVMRGGGGMDEMARSVPPVVETVSQTAPVESGTTSTSVGNVAGQATPVTRDSVDYQVIERGAEAAQTGKGPGAPPENQAPQTGSSVSAVEFFARLGASVAAEGQVLRVSSVSSGSSAERSGLKAGDALIAVDGVRLVGDIALPAGFRGTIVQLSRPGVEKPVLLQIR